MPSNKQIDGDDNQQEEPIPSVECEHEWEVIDDSFDHEYGCEVIVFERCEFCGTERSHEPMTFDDDVI